MRDLAEVFDPSLRLPIRGKTYVVPAPSAAVGTRLMSLAVISAAAVIDEDAEKLQDALQLTDEQETDFIKLALGSAFDEMNDDGLPYAFIEHAGNTAWMHWCFGADAGTAYWESGGKATAAWTPPAPTTSTSTAEASTTKQRGSGTGTKSRTKKSHASKPKRAAKPSV